MVTSVYTQLTRNQGTFHTLPDSVQLPNGKSTKCYLGKRKTPDFRLLQLPSFLSQLLDPNDYKKTSQLQETLLKDKFLVSLS